MYYINLPWYSQLLWIICVLVVMLPVFASIAIAGTMAYNSLFRRKEHMDSEFTASDLASQVGITMADGGDSVQTDGEKKH